MLAIKPVTVGEGNVPMVNVPLDKAERKSQLSRPSAVRNSAAMVEKSGFFDTLMPVFQAWKQ